MRDTLPFSWNPVSQQVLFTRPEPEELRARWQFLYGLFRERIWRMPVWWADEFTKILAGAARGPLLDFDCRCQMQRFGIEINRAARRAEHE